MFKDLFNLSYQRNVKQAAIFYIFFAIVIFLVGLPISDRSTTNSEEFAFFVFLGVNLVLSFLILSSKRIAGEIQNVLLMSILGGLTYVLSPFVGLIIVAYFTILPSKKGESPSYNIFNFSCQRNIKQAIVFYIAYSMVFSFVAIGLVAILVAFFGVAQARKLSETWSLGLIIMQIEALTLSYIILNKKGLFQNLNTAQYFVFAGTMTWLGSVFSFVIPLAGILLGLIPVAYMTMFKDQSAPPSK
jgi:hypothetical protein